MRSRLATVMVALLAVGACGDVPISGGGKRLSAGSKWEQIAASPLSARRSPHAFEVDGRLLVVGGTEAEPCPANADCVEPKEPPLRDGAFYDPVSNTWEKVAEAPVPLGFGTGTVVDDALYLMVWGFAASGPGVKDAFISYDSSTDTWSELDLPPVDTPPTLTTFDGRVVAFQTAQENGIRADLVYDPKTAGWSRLPPDPLRPSFDRSMVGTDSGLVLIGIENVAEPGAEEPAVYRATILKGDRWRRLPDSEVIGWDPEGWAWSGEWVINASLESADGGEVGNWGRFYPAGGMLDPATGEWAELPDAPEPDGGWSLHASSERGMTRGGGWALDARELDWHPVPNLRQAPDSEEAVAWVDERLLVWGGVRYDGNEGSLVGEGWVWAPDW